MKRDEPTQRVLSLLRALQAPRGLRASELAAQLDVGTRDVRSALRILEEGGLPLIQEIGGPEVRWRLAWPGKPREWESERRPSPKWDRGKRQRGLK